MDNDDLVAVSLSSSDGSEAKVLIARAAESERGVLVLPALGIPESYYGPLLRAFRARGISAAVLGAPTFADASKKPPSYGYAELALDYVPRALALLDVPHEGRFLVGHSLGGAVAGIHTGVAKDVAGIALVAAGTPYHRAYTGKAWMRTYFGTAIIGRYASIFDYFPGDKVGFGGRMSGKLAREWASIAHTGKLSVSHASGVDAEAALAEVRCPVLAIVLAKDDFAPEKAVRHLTEKMRNAQVRVHRYVPPRGHAEPDHNRWPRDPEPFADIITAFVQAEPAARTETALPHVQAA